MRSLFELANNAYEISKNNGFRNETVSIHKLQLLFQSEVSEALEDYRNNREINEVWYERKTESGIQIIKSNPLNTDKPCGIPSELADIVIRIAECFVEWKYNPDVYYEIYSNQTNQLITNFIEGLSNISMNISKACKCLLVEESLSEDGCKYNDIYNQFVRIIFCTFILAYAHGIDLWKCIDQKMEYNKTRGFRHGGKKC